MQNALDELVDIMRVPVDGDPGVAVVRTGTLKPSRVIECEILIVGGGTGGVAAALAAARRGRKVHLLEETDWVGGQFTSQGVSALDEHEHIENFGGTANYYTLRNALRDHYRAHANDAGPFGRESAVLCSVSGKLMEHHCHREARLRLKHDFGTIDLSIVAAGIRCELSANEL
jgi:alkyl hydroperoxide reductase subunit AhpF